MDCGLHYVWIILIFPDLKAQIAWNPVSPGGALRGAETNILHTSCPSGQENLKQTSFIMLMTLNVARGISLYLFTQGDQTLTSLYSPVTESKCTPDPVFIMQFISFSYIFKDCFINLEALPSKNYALAPVYFIGRRGNTALSLLSQFVERPRGSVRNSCRLWHKAWSSLTLSNKKSLVPVNASLKACSCIFWLFPISFKHKCYSNPIDKRIQLSVTIACYDRLERNKIELHNLIYSFYFTTQLVEYKVERLEFYEKMLSNTWDPFISTDYQH